MVKASIPDERKDRYSPREVFELLEAFLFLDDYFTLPKRARASRESPRIWVAVKCSQIYLKTEALAWLPASGLPQDSLWPAFQCSR